MQYIIPEYLHKSLVLPLKEAGQFYLCLLWITKDTFTCTFEKTLILFSCSHLLFLD